MNGIKNKRWIVNLHPFKHIVVQNLFEDDIYERLRVDTKARLEGVKALIAVREEFRGIVDLQVVAFAQDGLIREPGADALMCQAMALGADVVGGIPWIEPDAAAAQVHISHGRLVDAKKMRELAQPGPG
jgi:hypothetical protein